MKLKTRKLLEENIGENFFDLGLGKDLLDTTSKTQSTQEKTNKLNFIKTTSLWKTLLRA